MRSLVRDSGRLLLGSAEGGEDVDVMVGANKWPIGEDGYVA